jgi:hypothetical protein
MADAIIGALRVVLGADTGAWEDGLKRAQSSADSFGSKVAAVFSGTVLAHAFEKVAELIKEQVIDPFKHGFETLEQFGSMAQKVGLPVDELSRFGVAASMSGASIDSLSAGLSKLSKNMLEVSKGEGEEARRLFAALGIAVTDANGALRSAGDVMSDIAGKFALSADGVGKTATALVLLGRGGNDLIPLLNSGKAGLKEMTEAAERMGLVVSTDTIAATKQFAEHLKVLTLAKQGYINLVLEGVLPALARMSEGFADAAKKGDIMRSFADVTVRVFKEIVVVGFQVAATAGLIAQAFRDVFAIASDQEGTQKAWDRLSNLTELFRLALGGARDEAARLFLTITAGAKGVAELPLGETALSKMIEDLAFKARVLKGDFSNLAPGFADAAHGLKLFGMSADESRIGAELLSPGLDKLNTAMLAFKGAQLTQDSLLPWQQYAQQIEQISLLFANGVISQDTFTQASRKAAESTAQAWDMAASSITGNLATGLKAFAAQNKSLAGVAKAAAIGQAIANTYTAATKALATYPPPLSFAAAAAAIVAGMGMVAQIQAQQFATGGTFVVGGGGSPDSHSMLMDLSASERVKVEPPLPGGMQGQGTRGEVQEITLRGGLRDIFSGDNLRDLFGALNAGHRDGYRLEFVPV